MNHRAIYPMLMLGLGMLSACGAARPSKYYELTVPGDTVRAKDPAPYPVTLLLGRMATSDLYRDDRIVYTTNGPAIGTYEYHRWAEPPSSMIDDVLLRDLQMSRRYENVLSLHSGVSGDYILRGHLYDLREIGGEALVARVTFEFDMRDVKTGSPVWSRYYSHDEPVSRKDVSAVVEAMDRNVQRGLSEVTDDLALYFSTHSSGNSAAIR